MCYKNLGMKCFLYTSNPNRNSTMAPTNNNNKNAQPLISATSYSFLLLISIIITASAPAALADGYGGYQLPGSKPPSGQERGNSVTTPITIQGVIYCRSSTTRKLTPLKGAFARIACLALDNRGYETAPFAILSRPTDSNGYFRATLLPSEVEENWKLIECKAFLDSSPDPKCCVPTDVNKGVSGARLPSNYTTLKNTNTRLYSVGPFEYTGRTV